MEKNRSIQLWMGPFYQGPGDFNRICRIRQFDKIHTFDYPAALDIQAGIILTASISFFLFRFLRRCSRGTAHFQP